MVTLIKYGALGGGEKYNVNQMWIDGLSTDTKPTTTIDGMPIPNGSVFTEVDTGKTYMFDKDNTTWYEVSLGGGGGGGGTSNYNALSNRPQINGTTLTGNKSSSDLGLQDKVLGAWTAGTATTHSTPAATDTVLQALEKIDNNQRLDETNILSKANTSDVNTATANLQAQINQIITPVTQDAEVQNARVDADSVTFQTLKERLDADYNRHDEEISRHSDIVLLASIPLVNNFKNELLSYISGGIPAQYVDQGIAWTDETYYLISNIQNIIVPQNYKVIVAMYKSDNESAFATGFEGTGTFNLSQYKYKYARFCVRKTNNTALSVDEAKAVKIMYKNPVFDKSPLDYDDICPKLENGYERTHGGITYTSDGESISITGTCATGGSYIDIYNSENYLPPYFKNGEQYYIEFDGLPSRANITITHKTSEGWQTTDRLVPLTYKQAYFTIPNNAISLRIAISINQGYTYNETFTPRIYNVKSLKYAQRVKSKSCKPMLTIVYDDGLTQFKDYILPIIQSKKVPIATSIIVSAIEEENPRVMTYADVKECYEKGAEVLVHSKERTEQEWGNSSDVIAYELRTAKHLLESKCCPLPNCYIYSAQSSMYPACRHAAEKEFSIAVASGSQGTKAANDGVTNYYGGIDPYYVERRWADGNWTSGEDCETVLKSWIDELAASKTGWQIWTRHNYEVQYESANAATLANVIDYALAKGIEIVTMKKGMSEYGLV